MEKYIKVYIKSKVDFPRKGDFWMHHIMGVFWYEEMSLQFLDWQEFDWYLQPIKDIILPYPNPISKHQTDINIGWVRAMKYMKSQTKDIIDEEIEKQILKIIDNSFEKISLPGIGKNKTDKGFIFNKNKASKEIAALFENMYPFGFIKWFTGKDSPVSVLIGKQKY